MGDFYRAGHPSWLRNQAPRQPRYGLRPPGFDPNQVDYSTYDQYGPYQSAYEPAGRYGPNQLFDYQGGPIFMANKYGCNPEGRFGPNQYDCGPRQEYYSFGNPHNQDQFRFNSSVQYSPPASNGPPAQFGPIFGQHIQYGSRFGPHYQHGPGNQYGSHPCGPERYGPVGSGNVQPSERVRQQTALHFSNYMAWGSTGGWCDSSNLKRPPKFQQNYVKKLPHWQFKVQPNNVEKNFSQVHPKVQQKNDGNNNSNPDPNIQAKSGKNNISKPFPNFVLENDAALPKDNEKITSQTQLEVKPNNGEKNASKLQPKFQTESEAVQPENEAKNTFQPQVIIQPRTDKSIRLAGQFERLNLRDLKCDDNPCRQPQQHVGLVVAPSQVRENPSTHVVEPVDGKRYKARTPVVESKQSPVVGSLLKNIQQPGCIQQPCCSNIPQHQSSIRKPDSDDENIKKSNVSRLSRSRVLIIVPVCEGSTVENRSESDSAEMNITENLKSNEHTDDVLVNSDFNDTSTIESRAEAAHLVIITEDEDTACVATEELAHVAKSAEENDDRKLTDSAYVSMSVDQEDLDTPMDVGGKDIQGNMNDEKLIISPTKRLEFLSSLQKSPLLKQFCKGGSSVQSTAKSKNCTVLVDEKADTTDGNNLATDSSTPKIENPGEDNSLRDDAPAKSVIPRRTLMSMVDSFSQDFNEDIFNDDEDDDILEEPIHLKKPVSTETKQDNTEIISLIDTSTPIAAEPSTSSDSEDAATNKPGFPNTFVPKKVISLRSSQAEELEDGTQTTEPPSAKKGKYDWGSYKIAKSSTYSLDSLLKEKQTTEKMNAEIVQLAKELKEDMKSGGMTVPHVKEKELNLEYRQQIAKLDVREQTIQDNHPGEEVFRGSHYGCLFTYPKTLTLSNCGYTGGSSFVDKQLLSLPPEMLLDFVKSEVLLLTFHTVSYPHPLLDWIFLLIAVHPNTTVVTQLKTLLSKFIHQAPGGAATWLPSAKLMATVLINYGANIQSLPGNIIDPTYSEENLRFSDDKENQSKPTLQTSTTSKLQQRNLAAIFYILIEAVSKRRALVQDKEMTSILLMLLYISLDKSLVTSTVRHDMSVSIATLLESISQNGWKDAVAALCENIPKLSSHHHNMLSMVKTVFIVGKSEHFRRCLALAMIQRILWNQFVLEDVLCMKVRTLFSTMAYLAAQRQVHNNHSEPANCDFYRMATIIRLVDLAVGNDTLPASERDDLNSLIEKLRGLISGIKDIVNIIDRTLIKDLMHRVLSKWNFMAQSMGKRQGSIFTWATQGRQSNIVRLPSTSQENVNLEMDTDNSQQSISAAS